MTLTGKKTATFRCQVCGNECESLFVEGGKLRCGGHLCGTDSQCVYYLAHIQRLRCEYTRALVKRLRQDAAVANGHTAKI